MSDAATPQRDDAEKMLIQHDRKIEVMSMHHEHLSQQIADLVVQLRAGDERFRRIEQGLEQNTVLTSEIRELMGAMKSGLKVLGWLGVAAKWLGGLAGAAVATYTALYALTHNGTLPK